MSGWRPRPDPKDPPDLPPFTGVMNELRVAHYWRLSAGAWEQESVESKARMMAYMLFAQTREAYRQQYREDQKERGKRNDESTFAAMRERLKTRED